MRAPRRLFLLAVLLTVGLAGGTPVPAVAAATGTITGKIHDPGRRWLQETVVHLVKVPGHYRPRTHVMEDLHLHFVPHVLAITFGDTVKYVNRDHVDHNVYSTDHEGFNLGVWGFAQARSYTYDHHTGLYVQRCDLHPDMLAYVWVNQNPYQATVSRDGTYTIRGVPPGHFRLAVWNSHLTAATQPVTVTAGATTHVDFTLRRTEPRPVS